MSQRFLGARWYKIEVSTLDPSVPSGTVVGQYANLPNAVFGALRKLRVEAAREVTVTATLLPPKPPKMPKAAYTRQLRKTHEVVPSRGTSIP